MEKLNNNYQGFTRYPEKVIQFGEGNFMRAFVDWQLQEMNKQGLFNGSAVVVQPIAQSLGNLFVEQDNLYTVILEGLLNGETINTSEIITTVNRVLNPYTQWEQYLALAEDEQLEFIVSNTTEAGIAFDETDLITATPPNSFPAKLTALLYKRFELKKPGFTVIPCELIDRNGEKLLAIIKQYADLWQLDGSFKTWLDQENTFCCSLVDRIVPGYPRDRADELNEKHGYIDNLMVKAEPFLLWVIEGPQSLKESLPLAKAGLNVIITDNMTPYRERKVHLLNGPHTAMVPLAQLAGLETVEEVMLDPDFSVFVDDLFTRELIPMLDLPQAELAAYAQQIKERFKNPFVRHELSAIALNSVSKYTARLLPVLLRYIDQKGQVAPYMTAALAALMVTYIENPGKDDEAVLALFAQAKELPVAEQVTFLLSQTRLWGQDLTAYPLVDPVNTAIEKIKTSGTRALLKEIHTQGK